MTGTVEEISAQMTCFLNYTGRTVGHGAHSMAAGRVEEKLSAAVEDLGDMAHAAEIHVKKKPGRQPGFSPKKQMEMNLETPPPAVAATVAPLVLPTEKEVQDALVAVNDKHGIDKAIECLGRFGVKRARELKEEQRLDFVALCKQAIA